MTSDREMKPIIVQHCAMPNSVGGPMTGLKLLLDSPLSRKYEFRTVFQTRPARGFSPRLIWRMAQEIRMQKPDLLHVRGLQNEGWHGVLAGRLAGCKHIVLSIHGSIGELTNVHPLKRWLFTKVLEPATVRMATRFYCVCKAQAGERKEHRAYAGIIHNAVQIHDSKVDRLAFRESIGVRGGDILCAFSGRLTIDKGLLHLADAINGVFECEPLSKLRFLIIGDGPLYCNLQRLLAPHCDAGRVIFLGARNDVRDILGSCEMFVFPTLHENLSNSLLEACSAGLAIVATDVGGNPEVVRDGAEAILVAPGCSGSLRSALLRLANNGEMRTAMSQAATLRANTAFAPQTTWRQLESLYDGILGKASNK
jgi:glycosyltransferase involved in cell wall biosynthesis